MASLNKNADVCISIKILFSRLMGLFSHACISKNVKWVLVDIDEKFHSFIKKHSISALTILDYYCYTYFCVIV